MVEEMSYNFWICIGITQLLLVSQLEALISEHANFHIIKIASADTTVVSG